MSAWYIRIWRVIPKWKQHKLEKHFRSFTGHGCFSFSAFPCISVFGMQVSPQFSFVVCFTVCYSSLFLCLVWLSRLRQIQCSVLSPVFLFSQENEHIYEASNLLLQVLSPRHCMCEHENNYFLCYASPQNKSMAYVLKTRERKRERDGERDRQSKITMSGAK